MNYFMSDIHGAAKSYFEMKDRIALKKNDTLYILGDIFDGNNKDPGACLRILDDIMKNDNIRLLLGDHEYAHIMYHLMNGNKNGQREWENMMLTDAIRGTRLHMHILNYLSQKEQDYYFQFLIEQDATDFVRIGTKTFYLVHGAPAVNEGELSIWQQRVLLEGINPSKNYKLAITSDPNVGDQLTGDEIIICGHTPTRYLMPMEPTTDLRYPSYQKIVYVNNKLCIDCGCTGDGIGKVVEGVASDLCCVGIDAAGFFVTHLKGDTK